MPRIQGKKFLLTFPQCTLTKEEVSQALESQFTVKNFTIARELHEDGSPHIHAVIVLESSPNTTNMRVFDINGYHPNIKTLKTTSDVERASKYCQKDGDFITNFEKSLSGRALLFKKLLENPGGLTPQFVKENPEIMALSFDSVKKWVSFCLQRPPHPVPRILPKKRHLWCYGPANTYKSTWLYAYIQCYQFPDEIPRNNDYSGTGVHNDLLYCDEYRGHLSVQELNRLCDGRTKLNTKGGSTSIHCPLIVIVSNFSINEIYFKCDPVEIDSVHARFHQYVFPTLRPKFPTLPYDYND